MHLPFLNRTKVESPLYSITHIPGTVALYDPFMDVYGRNVSVSGADFQTGWWDFSDVVCTVIGGQPDPDGGNNAYRIQSGPSSSRVRRYSSTRPKVASVVSCGLWYKVNAGAVWFGKFAQQTSLLTEALWTHVAYTSSNNNLREYIGVNYKDDSLDVTVYHPQSNLGPILHPYSPPAGLPKILTDRSGHGNHAQLGSTSGEDTNDPLWTHVSNYFDGVDDVYSNWPEAEYELHAWGNTINSFGWVSAVPTETVGHYFGGILLNRTPGAGEEARIKGAMRALLASRGVALA